MPYVSKNVAATVTGNVGIEDALGDRLGVNGDGSINVSVNEETHLAADFLDTPLLDASVTNIPKSSDAPLTVVASLAYTCYRVNFIDTTGAFIGLYSDPAGTPALEYIIGPGSDVTIDLTLAATTVLGVRNMEDADITVGNLAINFMI